MQHITAGRTRIVAIVVAMAVAGALAAGCGGDSGNGSEEPTDGGAQQPTDDVTEPAPTPEESAEAEVATADEIAASAEGPEGYDDAEPHATGGTSPSMVYANEIAVLTNSFDPMPEAQRAEEAGLAGITERRWAQQVEDRQNTAAVVIADFGDDATAAAEFELLRQQADAATGGGDAEAVGSADDTRFAIAASFGMVQIDPNTGQQTGPTPRATLGVQLHGPYIVLVSTFMSDGDLDDGSTWQALSDSLAR
jgi:hypothetical protein